MSGDEKGWSALSSEQRETESRVGPRERGHVSVTQNTHMQSHTQSHRHTVIHTDS